VSVQECMHIEQLRQIVDATIGAANFTFYERKIGSEQTNVGFHGFIGVLAWVNKSLSEDKNFQYRDSATGEVKRGINLGVTRVANKGSVGVAFRFWHTSLAFVGCHLTSDSKGKSKLQARNKDANDIIKSMQFDYDDLGFDFPNTQHVCFVAGDLNYRMATTVDEGMALLAEACKTDGTDEEKEERWQELLRYDELQYTIESLEVLHDFHESTIRFPPTYRRMKGLVCKDFTDPEALKESYSWQVTEADGSVSQRTPSYTDRILWHTLPAMANGGCRCESYEQLESIRSSDHNPVAASFDVQINQGATTPSNDPKWAASVFQVSISELLWQPLDNVRDSAPFSVEIVFPIQAEDPYERARKLNNVQAALSVSAAGNGADLWQRAWRFDWQSASSVSGVGITSTANHHTGMHLLFRILKKNDVSVAQGVLSLRDMAFATGTATFQIPGSLGGKLFGHLSGNVVLTWRGHASDYIEVSADDEPNEVIVRTQEGAIEVTLGGM